MKKSSYISLTHTIAEGMPSWDDKCTFHLKTELDYHECTTDTKFKVNSLSFPAGIGTHIDAPAHCIPGGKTVDQLELNNIFECHVIDVSAKADAFYKVSVQDIYDYEHRYGPITEKSVVMIRTGWDKFWLQPEKYRNNYQFPSVSPEAALYIIEKNITALAIDTLSPDLPGNKFQVHDILLKEEIAIIENVANLEKIPPHGTVVLVAPLLIKDATEAPLSLIAFIDQEENYE
jgi:kynurenine formamidase